MSSLSIPKMRLLITGHQSVHAAEALLHKDSRAVPKAEHKFPSQAFGLEQI